MAISASTVFECRASGTGVADTNGGGFVAGASGTDYSQQNAPQYGYTNLAVDGTTNTKVTSASHNFVAADVGNIMNISAGTGWTPGFYQITSVASNAATLDRSPAATSTTGGTFAVGGALLTLGKLAGAMAASNKAYITGTFTLTTGITMPTSSLLIGYTSSRTDLGKAIVNVGANITAISSVYRIRNVTVDYQSTYSGTAISTSGGNYSTVTNVKCANMVGGTSIGVQCNNYSVISQSEFTGFNSSGNASCVAGGGGVTVSGCWFHDNTKVQRAIIGGSATSITNCLFANSAGVGCSFSSNSLCQNNTFYGVTIGAYVGSPEYCTIKNNIFANGSSYGMQGSSAYAALPQFDGNAYYSNTSGNRNNLDDTSGINGVSPYTNVLEVILTASPFVNAVGGDFTLNNTAGGGAACRGHGIPGTLPGSSLVGYRDFGVFQHQDAGGLRLPRSWQGGYSG